MQPVFIAGILGRWSSCRVIYSLTLNTNLTTGDLLKKLGNEVGVGSALSRYTSGRVNDGAHDETEKHILKFQPSGYSVI